MVEVVTVEEVKVVALLLPEEKREREGKKGNRGCFKVDVNVSSFKQVWR